jgi:ParB/RepB/Spo0J family partition protein
MEVVRITPDPDQPRKSFSEESLARLSESLKKFGQLLPIRVRWDQALGKWVIISGERRYRAALKAGLSTVTCHFVEDELPSSRVLEEQVVENCQREGLSPVEQAKAYQALMDSNGWSARKVAEELGLASGTVTKALSILKLPADVQKKVETGELPSSVAYEISRLDGHEAQRTAAASVTDAKLTRDEALALVKRKDRQGAATPEGKVEHRDRSHEPLSPPLERAIVVERSAQTIDGRASITYILSNHVTITITAPAGGQAKKNVVAALEGVLKEVQHEVTTQHEELQTTCDSSVSL